LTAQAVDYIIYTTSVGRMVRQRIANP
jgi:hypothetical protein